MSDTSKSFQEFIDKDPSIKVTKDNIKYPWTKTKGKNGRPAYDGGEQSESNKGFVLVGYKTDKGEKLSVRYRLPKAEYYWKTENALDRTSPDFIFLTELTYGDIYDLTKPGTFDRLTAEQRAKKVPIYAVGKIQDLAANLQLRGVIPETKYLKGGSLSSVYPVLIANSITRNYKDDEDKVALFERISVLQAKNEVLLSPEVLSEMYLVAFYSKRKKNLYFVGDVNHNNLEKGGLKDRSPRNIFTDALVKYITDKGMIDAADWEKEDYNPLFNISRISPTLGATIKVGKKTPQERAAKPIGTKLSFEYKGQRYDLTGRIITNNPASIHVLFAEMTSVNSAPNYIPEVGKYLGSNGSVLGGGEFSYPDVPDLNASLNNYSAAVKGSTPSESQKTEKTMGTNFNYV